VVVVAIIAVCFVYWMFDSCSEIAQVHFCCEGGRIFTDLR
jgi:hypothetical protein